MCKEKSRRIEKIKEQTGLIKKLISKERIKSYAISHEPACKSAIEDRSRDGGFWGSLVVGVQQARLTARKPVNILDQEGVDEPLTALETGHRVKDVLQTKRRKFE